MKDEGVRRGWKIAKTRGDPPHHGGTPLVGLRSAVVSSFPQALGVVNPRRRWSKSQGWWRQSTDRHGRRSLGLHRCGGAKTTADGGKAIGMLELKMSGKLGKRGELAGGEE
jgi:hypothetical protein